MKKIAIFLLLILILISKNSYAFLNFKIERKEVEKIKILFTNFEYSQSVDEEKQRINFNFLNNIISVITTDLSSTNLFDIENKITLKRKNEKFTNGNGLEAVLSGIISANEDGSFQLEINLQNILDKKQVLNETYLMNDENWKKNSHIISEKIYQKLTGKSIGHFNSKILYVAIKDKKNKIAMVDFDGGNLKYLTNNKNLVLTPIFSKKNKEEIFYLEYINMSPKIQKMNIIANEKEEVGNFEGMTFTPNFHQTPENILLFSAFKNNLANIYRLELNENKLTKLTYSKFIDTTPYFSADGEKIVFCSNRSGSQKLYIMDKDGKNIEKISHNRGSYSKPAWSSDGKLIAFVKMYKDTFYVGVMSPNGDSERDLISAYSIEGIKWSTNGRYLMYSKKTSVFAKPYIYIIDILGKHEYRIPTPIGEGAIDPDWS